MALHDSRTFFLEGRLPTLGIESVSCQLSTPSDAPMSSIRPHRSPKRLLGWSPTLSIRAAEPGPVGRSLTDVPRHAFVLKAVDPEHSTAEEAAFFVASELVARLRAGDLLRLVYSHNADLGLRVDRGGRLIVAVGALTALGLRDEITVSLPWDLVERAEAVFIERDPAFLASTGLNPKIMAAIGPTPVPCPYSMRCGDLTAIVTTFTRQLGPFDVGQVVPAVRGFEGSGAKGFIVRRGVIDADSARLTARMLADGPATVIWQL